MKADDRCQCRGQCGLHTRRCAALFGQPDLFGGGPDAATRGRRTGDRRVCSGCAKTYDPDRAAKERRAERALTERAGRFDHFLPKGEP